MTESRVDHRRSTTRWIVLAIAVVALHAIWSLSIPLMASPDEPSHVVRAAAVARGQWAGEMGPPPTDGSRPGTGTIVQLPSEYAQLVALPNCFAYQPEQPASCQQDVPPSDQSSIPVETFAGQYPPLYYALVGWPSLVTDGEASVYAMRLVSGVLAAALLVWGVFRLLRSARPGPAVWASAVAITPMVLFMGATVNPQALEISSAFAFWAACVALATSTGRPSTAVVVQATVTGVVLVNSRASGPIWALAAVVIAVLLAPRGRLRELWAARSIRLAGLAAIVSGILAVVWVVTHGGVVTAQALFPEYTEPFATARQVARLSPAYVRQAIGDFGWLDAPSPPLTVAIWVVAGALMLVMALVCRAPRRGRLALGLLTVGVAAAPFALQIPTAPDAGLVWQGRYVLPLAVGLPIVAANVLTAGRQRRTRTIARWVLVAVAGAQVAAFYWASRRYSEGLDGALFTVAPDWSSPLGYLSAVALYTGVWCVVGVLGWRATADVATEPRQPAPLG